MLFFLDDSFTFAYKTRPMRQRMLAARGFMTKKQKLARKKRNQVKRQSRRANRG